MTWGWGLVVRCCLGKWSRSTPALLVFHPYPSTGGGNFPALAAGGPLTKAARKPKTTAEVTPRPVSSKAPVKRPSHPSRFTSERIPVVMALPKPQTGIKAPAPANCSRGW